MADHDESVPVLMVRAGRHWRPLYLQSCVRCGEETFGVNCAGACTNEVRLHRSLGLPSDHPTVVAEKERRHTAWQLQHYGRTW